MFNRKQTYQMLKDYYGFNSVEELIQDLQTDIPYQQGMPRRQAEKVAHRIINEIVTERLSNQLCEEADRKMLQNAY